MLAALECMLRARLASVRRFWFFYAVFPVLVPLGMMWMVWLGQRLMGARLPLAAGDAEYLVAGAAVAVFLWGSVSQVGVKLAWARRLGELEYLGALGVPTSATVLATVSFPLLFSLPAFCVLVLVGSLMLDTPLRPSPLLPLVVAASSYQAAAFGALVAMWLPTFELVSIATSTLPLLIVALTPLVFPPRVFPEALAVVGWAIPFTWAADAMRGALFGGETRRILLEVAGMLLVLSGILALAAKSPRTRLG